jgi:hypothetical protein
VPLIPTLAKGIASAPLIMRPDTLCCAIAIVEQKHKKTIPIFMVVKIHF